MGQLSYTKKMKKKKNYKILVKEHYKIQARQHKTALSSTMEDSNTRRLEIKNIVAMLKNGDKCLEIGCGNGAASVEISKAKKLDLTCIDFSPDLIKLAKSQSTVGIKGKIEFKKGDVLELKTKNTYDTIFTERCVINLLTWSDQKTALKNMSGVLKNGGKLILLEAFSDGLETLNKARQEIGLDVIPPAYHNLHLKKDRVIKYLATCGVRYIQENNFLSTHYFGSRILYPAFAKVAKRDLHRNSAFNQFFALLPPVGNYAHIKILEFVRGVN